MKPFRHISRGVATRGRILRDRSVPAGDPLGPYSEFATYSRGVGEDGVLRAVIGSPAYAPLSACLLGVSALFEVWRMHARLDLVLVTALAAIVPLAWRRTQPAVAYPVIFAALLNAVLWPQMFLTVSIAAWTAFYILSRHRLHHPAVLTGAGFGAVALVNLAYGWVGPYDEVSAAAHTHLSVLVVQSALPGLTILAVVATGDAVRSRGQVRRERRAAAMRMIAAHKQRAVAVERARIARELHDVVSHSVSMISVQAETATYATPGLSAQGRDSFQQIAGTARSTMAELRRLLDVLRTDDAEDVVIAPQPSLNGLPALLRQHEDAGGNADLCVHGEYRPLPAAVDLSAYRIAQEALTNVRKHAPGARAHVNVVYGSDELVVTIADDGPGTAVTDSGRGYGLVGIRERVELLEGRLRVGTGPEGGVLIDVRLPLTQRRTSPQ